MNRKKKSKVKKTPAISPATYIKQKARSLPFYKCYINESWEATRKTQIVVARWHTNGHITFGVYLVDRDCLGIKDALIYFNLPLSEFLEMMDNMNDYHPILEIDYTLAHNIIFAALDFAAEYGFKPHPDFALAKYILEEDTDNIEPIAIECGIDGKPHYERGPLDSASDVHRILTHLEKKVGSGNFTLGKYQPPQNTKSVLNDIDEWVDNFDDDPFEDFDDLEDDYFEDEDEEVELGIHNDKMKNSVTYQFKIQIRGISNPPVWRRILLPSYYSFQAFHVVIQETFGWLNCHMFDFSPEGWDSQPSIKNQMNIDAARDLGEDDQSLVANQTLLSDIFTAENQRFLYVYDYGDHWEHDIILEKIISEISLKPRLTNGKGLCPPEDCGGIFGFKNLKSIMTDPRHPEYAETHEWLNLLPGESYDPENFNLKDAQENLIEIFK